MRIDYTSPIALEAIEYQDISYYQELSGLFRKYKEKGYLDKRQFEIDVTKSIKNRFNINVDFRIDPSSAPNAYVYPPSIDESNVLSYRAWGGDKGDYMYTIYKDFTREANKKVVEKILKGDLSPTGLMNYKTARVDGLFANLPPGKTCITAGMIKLGTPEECAAIMLHEIGHYWTFLEWIGVRTCRNAAIMTSVNEYLGATTEEEKINIIIRKNNHYNLDVDPTRFSKLEKEDATNVMVGIFESKFKNSQGYVQYDNNMSEFIADQFAARMCGGEAVVTGLYKIYKKYGMLDESRNATWELLGSAALTIVSAIGVGFSIMMTPQAIASMAVVLLFSVVNFYGIFLNSENNNGSTYDGIRDRFQRVYNEEVKRLKSRKLSVEQVQNILHNLNAMRKCIEQTTSPTTSLPAKILRAFSKNYREQENKMFYQQLTEELLANKLYVASAKFKTLQG